MAARKNYTSAQIINALRRAEVGGGRSDGGQHDPEGSVDELI